MHVDVTVATCGVVNMHVGVAEIIVALSNTHILCYTEVWGAEIGPAATGHAGPAPTALY